MIKPHNVHYEQYNLCKNLVDNAITNISGITTWVLHPLRDRLKQFFPIYS